jgi:APA family basic amino acid/polyamine antiporter
MALNMVIGNMVGTGVFTSIGYQVDPNAIPDPFTILVIWFLGGVLAFCGALSYAEVATTYPVSGGEYSFLSRLYHPLLGMMSGWVSIIVGFSAAIAALAKASAAYLIPFIQSALPTADSDAVEKILGTAFIFLSFGIQLLGNRQSGSVQIALTSIKLLFIVFIIISAIFHGDFQGVDFSYFKPTQKSWNLISSAGFAGSLVWVMYAYSGWNASTYVVEQLEQPKRDLIGSVLWGTVTVTVLYVLLNMAFMHVIPLADLSNQLDPGNLMMRSMFSDNCAGLFSLLFGVTLLAGMNAMFISGPRVAQRIGSDYPALGFLSQENHRSVPVNAALLITMVTLIFFWTLSFETIVEYTGVTLSIFSTLTVLGVFIIRHRRAGQKETVLTWGYPVTPLLFIGISCWMIWYFVSRTPMILFWSFLTLLPAVLIHSFGRFKQR